jgi:hypothetical protein
MVAVDPVVMTPKAIRTQKSFKSDQLTFQNRVARFFVIQTYQIRNNQTALRYTKRS